MNDWQTLIETSGPMVWRTAMRLLGDHADAADCFQETFLEFVKRARRADVANPPSMLRSIATARAIDRLRTRTRDRRRTDAVIDLNTIAASNANQPARQAENAEIIEHLRDALAELPAQQSQAYALRYFDDLAYDEIARAMEITTQSVGVLLHRARQQLQRKWPEWAPEKPSVSSNNEKQT